MTDPLPLNNPSECATSAPRSWRCESLIVGLYYYTITSFIAVAGVVIGHGFFKPAQPGMVEQRDVLSAFANWDGVWYAQIARVGYTYDPDSRSSIVFFPAFPLLGRLVAYWTGLRVELALLLIAQVSLASAFVIFASYLKRRSRATPDRTDFALLAFGLWPTSFFLRVAYSESLLILVITLVLYGMDRRWPLIVLAVLVGAGTAVRSVGIALVPPLVFYVWQRSSNRKSCAARLAWVLPVAGWGLFAFMAFQYGEYGNPLAFVHNQTIWDRRPPSPLLDKVVALATLEPLWSVYVPSSPSHWTRHGTGNPLTNLQWANPILFSAAAVLVIVGCRRRWLSGAEVVLSAGLLVIPYLTKSHENYLAGHGRFAVLVLPAYIVIGNLLSRLPAPITGSILALGGFFVALYGALFGSWYRFT